MIAQSANEVAKAIAEGQLWSFFAVFILCLVGSAIGTFLTTYFQEKAKGRITKEIWLSQEKWQKRFDLYTVLIGASEEIAAALWSIVADPRVLPSFPPDKPSMEAEGLKIFPEHQEFLGQESKAIEKISGASVGANQGERIKICLASRRRPRPRRENQGLRLPASACGRCCLSADVA